MMQNPKALFFGYGALVVLLFVFIEVFHLEPPVAALLMIVCGLWFMSFYYSKSSLRWAGKSLSFQQKTILKEFDFYQTLNLMERQEFERRVAYLIQNKEFSGRKDLVITERMKVLIAATFAQIGFGFKFISFEDFEKIIIFPKAYYSKYTGRYHKGEVNTSGAIVLSWEDFLEGFRVKDDGYNLGLHELAHALRLEDAIPGNEYHFLKEADLANWNALAEKEFEKIRAGNPSFIRTYGGTNHQEFFAVCVEQFFEQPEAFHKALPQLYQAMALLLKQNPLKRRLLNI